jgi:phosphopentomutase
MLRTPPLEFRKIICVVLDGVGVGEAPDAAAFGDAGSDSLGNTARHVGSLRLPVLERMGLGNIEAIEGVPPCIHPAASVGRMMPRASGKDSISGHWELMGCVLDEPFPTFPNGFPDEVVRAFREVTGHDMLCNRPASGTAVIQEFGEAHLCSHAPIVYTSQDSVFQIAAHEDVIAVDALYQMCEAARGILVGSNGVARVIARPSDRSRCAARERTSCAHNRQGGRVVFGARYHRIVQDPGQPRGNGEDAVGGG